MYRAHIAKTSANAAEIADIQSVMLPMCPILFLPAVRRVFCCPNGSCTGPGRFCTEGNTHVPGQ